jgi:hypothetical protein
MIFKGVKLNKLWKMCLEDNYSQSRLIVNEAIVNTHL